MLSPVSNDDEDVLTSPHSGGPPSPGADLAPWKKRIGAAIALVVIAAGSFGYAVRHDNTPPPVVFEPADGGESPAPLSRGDEAGHAPSAEPTDAELAVTPASPANGGPTPLSAAPTSAAPTSSGPATMKVHVSGHVARPGVYSLAPGARVEDAVAAAGGAASDGDTDGLNLAAYAQDGTRIFVPGKTAPPSPQAGAALPDTVSPGSNSTKHPPGQTVNLNQATAEELQTLPTVGSEMANRILAYRRLNGRFGTVEELNRVEGIGPGKMAKLRPYVMVS